MHKEEFFKFNLGHVVLLLTWIVSAVWFIASFKQTVTSLQKAVDLLESRQNMFEQNILDVTRTLDKINYAGSTVVQDFMNHTSQRFNTVDSRVMKLEEAVNKMTVIYTDITWLKDHVSENFDDDKMLLKLLNEHILNDTPRSQSVK